MDMYMMPSDAAVTICSRQRQQQTWANHGMPAQAAGQEGGPLAVAACTACETLQAPATSQLQLPAEAHC